MRLGERTTRGQLPGDLTSIGTCKAHPYHPPVPPSISTVSSNTFTSCRRIKDQTHTTPWNRETPPQIRSQEGTSEKTRSRLLRGSLEDKESSPSPSSSTAAPPWSSSSNHSCNLDFYCGFVFEFDPFLSFIPQDYDDVLDCLHVWVVLLVLGEMEKP